MTSYVAADLRRIVEARASYLCEYCQVHEDDTYLGCQVDHIIAEKHGGLTVSDNLAYACTFCNRNKGTDIASVVPSTGALARLFNPRVDRWTDHFKVNGSMIEPQSAIGETTARLLGFNQSERIRERELLRRIGRYPPQAQ